VQPEIEYARSGDVNIAYTTIGSGDRDLLFMAPWASNLDVVLEYPAVERGFETLAGIGRMILFDRRGTGLSDRLCEMGTLEEGMDDVLTVLDAVGTEKVAVMAVHEAGGLAMLLAATHPERISGLVLYGSFASTTWHEDYPWGQKPEERQIQIDYVVESWGKPDGIAALVDPKAAEDEHFRDWWAKWQRNSISKDVIRRGFEILALTDVRSVLPAIKVPTLILHRTESLAVPIENARYLNEHIPTSQLVELEGDDFLPFLGDTQSIVDEVEEFLTGSRTPRNSERILSTLLFADIVDSTSTATQMGDQRWKDLLDQIDKRVTTQVEWHGGRLVKQLGDGYLAMFDRPAQAVRAAAKICKETKALGVQFRSGLHTGEVELRGEDIGGIAVHIAARVMDAAKPGEILVSGALPPLVAGAGITFEDRGPHQLKGVDGSWSVFAVS
jgi:class 3 adenylate cyclase